MERILESFRKKNIPLWNAVRLKNGVRFCTAANGIELLQEFCSTRPKVKFCVELCGALRFKAWTRRHMGLCCMLAVSLLSASVFGQFVWKLDLSGVPVAVQTQVCSVLQDAEVKVPIAKHTLDTSALRDLLLLQLPQLSFAEVYDVGVTLCIDAQLRHEIPVPPDMSGDRNDLVAMCDAQIISIAVTSGTACVQAGDIVQKGDILILGQAGREGFVRSVRAQGIIQAQVFYTDTFTFKKDDLLIKDTVTDTARSLFIGKLELPLQSFQEDFIQFDQMVSRQYLPMQNMQMPIYIETTTRTRLQQADTQTLIFRAQQSALAQTMRQMHEDAELIDTDYEYSIRGDTIEIRCTLTAKLLLATTQEVHAQ